MMRVHRSTSAHRVLNWVSVGVASVVACSAPPSLPPPAPTVIACPAVRADSARELRLSGVVEAERSTAASFAVMGTVERVLVKEGESVRRGQVLARLSPRSYEDALGIAKAKADQAEDAYRRLEPMYRNQTLPEVKMVEIEAGRRQARLALSMARKNLDDTVLRAPEAGVVARRHIEPGVNVTPGLPIVTLVQTKTVLATAPVPEVHVAQVKKGDAARVRLPASGKTVAGTVREISVLADPLTRTYEIKIALDNSADELRIGMVADVRLRLPGQGQAILVAPEAIRVDENGSPCAFVVGPDYKLTRRKLEVGGFVEEKTAVTKGLAEGELVVTSGTPMLAQGMTVRVVKPESRR